MKILLSTLALATAASTPAQSQDVQLARGLVTKTTSQDASGTGFDAKSAMQSAKEALRRAFTTQSTTDTTTAAKLARQALANFSATSANTSSRLASARSLLGSLSSHDHGDKATSKELIERLQKLERELEAVSEELRESLGEESGEGRRYLVRSRDGQRGRANRLEAYRRHRVHRGGAHGGDTQGEGREGDGQNIFWHNSSDGEGQTYRFEIKSSDEGGEKESKGPRYKIFSDSEVQIWSSEDGEVDVNVHSPFGSDEDVEVFKFRTEHHGEDGKPTIYRWRTGDDKGKSKGRAKSKSKTWIFDSSEHDDKGKSKHKSKTKSKLFFKSHADDDSESSAHVFRVEIPDVDVRFPEPLHIAVPHGLSIAVPEFPEAIEFPQEMTEVEIHTFPEMFHGQALELDSLELEAMELESLESIGVDIAKALEDINIEIPEIHIPDIVIPEIMIPHGSHGMIQIEIDSDADGHEESHDVKVRVHDPASETEPEAKPTRGRSQVVEALDETPGVALASHAPVSTSPAPSEDELLGELIELMRELKGDMGALQADIRSLHAQMDAADADRAIGSELR